jgi:hypothetical protein
MRRHGVLALALLVALVLAAAPAQGERTQRGNLIVAINGGISPLKLPRDHPAPVAITLEGRISTADASPLPRAQRLELALAGRGLLDTRGLPICPRRRLRNADGRQALERCGGALVGHGVLKAQALVPHQGPIAVQGSLLAFNGRTATGGRAIWAHVFAANPPVSMVLPFVVRRRKGSFPTALVATVPDGLVTHLASFKITLARRFTYRGLQRSYISASCPVPAALTAGFLSFARATYGFADDRRLTVTAVRSCRAR